MKPKQAVTSLISYLDENIGPPVRTAMAEDSNPRPVVTVEDWDKENKHHHNTSETGFVLDDDGNPDKSVLDSYYTLRIDFRARAKSESAVYDIGSKVESLITVLSENPQSFHDHLHDIRFTSMRGVQTYHTLEPSEGSVSFTIKLDTFDRTTMDVSTIEEIGYETSYN